MCGPAGWTGAWLLALGFVLSGCAELERVAGPPRREATSEQTGPTIAGAQAEAYNGPKARIAVKDFEDKMSSSGHYRAEYGRGMRDMLTTALFQTNRYVVLEREKLEGVVQELRGGTSDLYRKEATVPVGELEGAELMITAAITGFDPGTSGGTTTLGGLIPGGLGQILGGIGFGFNKASLAMDLRVIEVRTGRVVAATSAQGEATAFAMSLSGLGGPMGGSLGGFAKTPMETAVREMIQKAVEFVVTKTPQSYYRHSDTAAAALAPGAPPGPKAIQTFRNYEQDVTAHLTEVTVRGAVITVVVSLSLMDANRPQPPTIELAVSRSHVLDYETGTTYPIISADGFTGGTLKGGEVKTLRVNFRAPTGAKAVEINLSGVGRFDDVKLGQ